MRDVTGDGHSGRAVRPLLAIALLLGLIASLASGSVMAQDDGVADEPAVTEAPPPPPTEPPPPPTAVPTEPPPPPTAVPTDMPVMPTEVPATEIRATDIPTEQPTGVPTEEPTPTPTATPDSTLTWSLAAEPDCRLADGEPTTVASGDGQVYTCTSTVQLAGTQVVPATVDLTWSGKATVDAGWAVQILRPKQDATDTVEWTEPMLGETTFIFDQRDPLGTDAEATDLDRTVTVSWAVRVIRPACNLDEPVLRLTHDVALTVPGANVVAQAVEQRILHIAPSLMPLPEPVVAATVSEFGTSEWTGQAYSPVIATASLTVTATCANSAWAIQLTISPFTGDALSVAVPLHIVGGTAADGNASVAIGGTVAPGVPYAVATGSGTATFHLELELTLPPTVPIGTYLTTMDFTVRTGP